MFPIRDHNPSGRTPYVTYALLAANILIFISYWSLFSQPRLLNQLYFDFALIPARISAGDNVLGLFTSMFLHGGVMHLVGNMLFLYIFGDNLEDEMGHVGFAVFYTLAGLAAGLTHVVAAPYSPVPTIGASGAIAGVMGGYLLLYPKARVDVIFIFIIFFKVIPIPAWIVLVIWFALQLVGGLGSTVDGAGVAYWAHAGGFVAGLLLTVPIWLRRGGTTFWGKTAGQPPHPEAKYKLSRSHIPTVRRKR